nr:MAG: tRNA glutamyl-Q(34) synthetase GluQRS [Hyphomicrobiales bacterium]
MIVTRFAPSPTGLLHLGHAFAALTAFEAAQAAGGKFLVRLEDIDRARCRRAYEEEILKDLAWLGLDWERPVRRHSEHFAFYEKSLERLREAELLYPCFCTRKEIADEIERASGAPHLDLPGAQGPLYPGTCRSLSAVQREARLSAGTPFALRIDIEKACALTGSLTFLEKGRGPKGENGRQDVRPELLGDVVLARKEMPTSYQLAVVVDDAVQGVSLVTRGEDLFHATHIQRLLQRLLGLPAPHYAHHRLIMGPDGKKFSKRDASVTLRALREKKMRLDDIKMQIGWRD